MDGLGPGCQKIKSVRRSSRPGCAPKTRREGGSSRKILRFEGREMIESHFL